MAYFSYKIEHDFGLAPNPFGSYCTLAVCKPSIRANKNLAIGDWIIGTGSVKLKRLHHLIFAMKVEEKITLDQYWNDIRFQYKKPVINGSLVQMYGDNFYHKKPGSKTAWIQENSAHSLPDGTTNREHLSVDTGGTYALISTSFYYLGDNSVLIPEKFREVCCEGRDMKGPSIPIDIADRFVQWIAKRYEFGVHGDPINWRDHF
jgi:hypothetical protein